MDEVTEKILTLFREISSVPRCSKNEEKIAMWLKEWALHHGLSVKFDSVNNVVIGIPGSKGYKKLPEIVIQGHMDMVCEKTRDCEHDFTIDPIVPVIEGDWLKAQGTTLGADNGIALAIALAIAGDKELAHPPLELLFTVDEETGLTGANALTPDFISGRVLLNVDSEDEGIFTVGCAGGMNTRITLPIKYSPVPEDAMVLRLVVDGLCGGHSGVDIHEKRANAIKLLATALEALSGETELRLLDITGGSAHNAIPRHAEARIVVSGEFETRALSLIEECENDLSSEYAELESSLSVKLKDAGKFDMNAMNDESSKNVISLLSSLPHGVASMSSATPGLVETSNNLATVSIENDELIVLTSQRSSFDSGLQTITDRISSISRDHGASCSNGSAYPPWQPDLSSLLLKQCQDVYQEVFKEDAKIEVIHAGLECAVIGSKYDDMDMISFGPTIKNPHSPDERLYIPSIKKVWDFMVELLASFDEKSKFGVTGKKV